ncbi:MAG TPA: PAS domain-containing protein, partial [Polyangiaceae bacterium]
MPSRAEPDTEDLHERLEEAEQTLEAIRSGHVDAVVVQSGRGPRVYKLESPDQPFRTFVEAMQEGALTVAEDGTILYANSFFASLVGRELSDVVGSKLR